MVRPKQHHSVIGAIERFQGIHRCLRNVSAAEGKPGEGLVQTIPGRCVVGVPKDLDIGVKRLESLAGVLAYGVRLVFGFQVRMSGPRGGLGYLQQSLLKRRRRV